jgi:hypothetical protein
MQPMIAALRSMIGIYFAELLINRGIQHGDRPPRYTSKQLWSFIPVSDRHDNIGLNILHGEYCFYLTVKMNSE